MRRGIHAYLDASRRVAVVRVSATSHPPRAWPATATSKEDGDREQNLLSMRITTVRKGFDASFVKPTMKAEGQQICNHLLALGGEVQDEILLPDYETGRSLLMRTCGESSSSILWVILPAAGDSDTI